MLLRDIRSIWERRDLLLTREMNELEPDLDRQVRTDLLELVAVWAEVRMRRGAPDEASATREEAMGLLREARASCGPSFAIEHRLRSIAGESGAKDRSADHEPAPTTASDHYELGRSFLRSGQFEKAAEEFGASLDLRPQEFWSNYYAGLTAYRSGVYEDAFTSFCICIALKPSAHQSFFNRAKVEEALQRPDRALRDYRHAWELDHRFTDALLNRRDPLVPAGTALRGDLRLRQGP